MRLAKSRTRRLVRLVLTWGRRQRARFRRWRKIAPEVENPTPHRQAALGREPIDLMGQALVGYERPAGCSSRRVQHRPLKPYAWLLMVSWRPVGSRPNERVTAAVWYVVIEQVRGECPPEPADRGGGGVAAAG